MNTLLMITAFLVLGLVALIFLYVLVKITQSLNDPYGLNSNSSDEDDEMIDDMHSFKIGFNRGLSVAQMSLYKMWVEGGETVVVGSYDNLQGEMNQNITVFFQDVENLKEWNSKFLTYMNSKKAEPPK